MLIDLPANFGFKARPITPRLAAAQARTAAAHAHFKALRQRLAPQRKVTLQTLLWELADALGYEGPDDLQEAANYVWANGSDDDRDTVQLLVDEGIIMAPG